MCCVNIYKKQVDIYFLLAIDSHDLAIKDFFCPQKESISIIKKSFGWGYVSWSSVFLY